MKEELKGKWKKEELKGKWKFRADHRIKAIKLLPSKQAVFYAIDCAYLSLTKWDMERTEPIDALRIALAAIQLPESVTPQTIRHYAEGCFNLNLNRDIEEFDCSFYAVQAAGSAAWAAWQFFVPPGPEYSSNPESRAAYYSARSLNNWEPIVNLYNQANQVWEEQYRTPDTVGIAREIIRTRNFDLMSILADAIIDLGGDDTYIRNAKGLSNWALYYLTQTRPATIRT